MLVCDEPGIDWRQFYLDQIKNLQWTPAQIGTLTLPQIFALWGEGAPRGAPEGNGQPGKRSRAEHLGMINDLRARFDLPPVEPLGDWHQDGDDWLTLHEE